MMIGQDSALQALVKIALHKIGRINMAAEGVLRCMTMHVEDHGILQTTAHSS
jgi:hypothetical protein